MAIPKLFLRYASCDIFCLWPAELQKGKCLIYHTYKHIFIQLTSLTGYNLSYKIRFTSEILNFTIICNIRNKGQCMQRNVLGVYGHMGIFQHLCKWITWQHQSSLSHQSVILLWEIVNEPVGKRLPGSVLHLLHSYCLRIWRTVSYVVRNWTWE